MKSVRLDSVSRVYGRTFALHRVTMELKPGRTTIILGENGAGKTTLLNILATLEKPSSGEVYFGKAAWSSFARRGRRNIGWISHDSLLYADLTGEENLQFYAHMYGIEADPGRWLERVGLEGLRGRRVSAYSRGMRQRLSIARALLHEPRILLLDEPLTGLDRRGREAMLELFRRERDRGAVVVMITHDFALPEDFVDDVAILSRGSLTYFGATTAAEMSDKFRQHA